MPSALLAARACARTILWQSLRLDAFRGAVPHVLIVVDQSPCTLQKVLLEGYRLELSAMNGVPSAPTLGPLSMSLNPSAVAPCYAVGLDRDWGVTYGVLPFNAGRFLDDVRLLQAFLRQCGRSVAAVEAGDEGVQGRRWPVEKLRSVFGSLMSLMAPEVGDKDGEVTEAWEDALFHALCAGPPRELLGCILIQRHAFQNELEKYRLRLDLFNMGLRVAEHNHLEIMSRAADALASGGDEGAMRCLEDEEMTHYMRSCSFHPSVAESVGRAIADSIDAWSWSKRRSADEDGELVPVEPPVSFRAALVNTDLLSLYGAGILSWAGEFSCRTAAGVNSDRDSMNKNNDNNSTRDGGGGEETAPLMITGSGAPLRIVCRDGQVLTYDGGLEDCLLNTGYYSAAHTPERNCVWKHRHRFPVQGDGDDAAGAGAGAERRIKEDGAAAMGDGDKRGRMKKKEYLSMLKHAGKRATASDGENEDGAARAGVGACVGSSIGGTFPIGEVITESFDLSRLNGTCAVFAYPSLFKSVTMSRPQAATLRIEGGIVTDVAPDAPVELVELIDLVRQAEGACYVRELGIGLSPYIGRERVVSDVTAFERQLGVHVSLGQRHPLFVKQAVKRNTDGTAAVHVDGPVLKRRAGKYHIDVFLDAARLEMGDFAVDFTRAAPSSPLSSPAAAAAAAA